MRPIRPLSLCLLATLAASPALSAVPAGFSDELVTAVPAPTDVAFTPDGRLLVTSQSGTLRVYAPPVYSAATVALSFAAGTLCSNSERGLLGVAVDPGFATNGYVYLFYTAQKPPTTGCPTGNTNVVNRVSRFTFSPPTASTINPATEVVLIDNIPSPNGNHNAGDLAFGKDGRLYVTTGEGGVSSAARDESFLGGKILRIDPAGATPAARIPSDNPWAQDPSAETCAVAGRTTTAGKTRCQETFAWGLRNPFRFAFDPGAAQTRFFINDVGQSTWEEIDPGQPGADYGWNVREGFCANGSTTDCGPPPAGMTNPLYAYQHGVQVPGTTSPTNCDSITGGAFVPAGSWPAGYDGSYLFADYICGWIFERQPGGAVADFATNLGGGSATSLTFGTVGSGTAQALYYTTYAGGGQVRRIRYTGAENLAPVPNITSPSPSLLFYVGQTITLSGAATDPEDGALPASALSWTVILQHDDQTHPVLGPLGGNDISFTAPPPDDLDSAVGSHLEIRLTATDSGGASTTVAIDLQPNRVQLGFDTSPSGLHLEVNGTDVVAPRTLVSWEAWDLDVSAPNQQDAGGNGWIFSSWSDAGDQSHTVTTPSAAASYTASFTSGPVLSVDDAGAASFVPTPMSAVFRVRRSNPTSQMVTVDYATVDGTAAAGTDYTATAGSLTFAPGTAMQTVAVPVTPGSVPGANRTFFLDLANPVDAGIAVGRGTGTVVKGPLPADFDGDGRPDLLWQRSSTGNLAAWFMDGATRTGGAALVPSAVNPSWTCVAVADFDGDHIPDILWQRPASGDLVVWFMNGVTRTGGEQLQPSRVDPSWEVVGAADFDGDQAPDLLFYQRATGNLVVWFMNGVRRRSGAPLAPARVDPSWRVAGLGDFDRDGKVDILFQHRTGGDLVLWFMGGVNRTGGAALEPDRASSLDWQVAGVADLDGDGKPDLLWRNRRTGDLVFWRMDGRTRIGGSALTPGRVIDPAWLTVAPR